MLCRKQLTIKDGDRGTVLWNVQDLGKEIFATQLDGESMSALF